MSWTQEQYDEVMQSRQKAARTALAPLRATNGQPAKKDKLAISPRFDAFLSLVAASGLPAPELEYVFHPTRRFKADYAWPAQKLIVERQGGLWAKEGTRAKKAHTMPLAILRDYEKANLAQLVGFTYLQFTPSQLDSGEVIETLRIRLADARP